ncbi:MAG: metal-sulfur cluster assembly factor [Aquificota bacterium]|nr:MAG: metal-sulfur cluster assembly factor [Aquificota bacterium]
MDKNDIYEILKNICDPEIPIDIVNLGLVKNVSINDKKINIEMTLTTPRCPLEELIKNLIINAIKEKYPDLEVNIKFVFNKPWTTEDISKEGKEKLRNLGWNV